VGVAAFVIAAVVSTAARSHVPAVLLGLLLLLAVLAVARFAGILYALPVGVVTIEAFDWYFLPPLRNLDGATVLVLGLFLGTAVIVGAVATQAGRRAAGSCKGHRPSVNPPRGRVPRGCMVIPGWSGGWR
jgi:K+-sensing histidine kinase KdpD